MKESRFAIWKRRLDLSADDLPIALTFIALTAIACITPPQTDTFFHLRAGQSIWQSGSIPTTELYSHTFPGRPWLNHEWLSQLLFYGLHVGGGPLLLTIVCAACAVIAVIASWRLTRGAADIRLILLLSLLILTPSEWAVRPQALSLALLMLTMWLVIRKKIGWLPLFMVAWANAHGVVLLGVVIAGANAFEALIWTRRDFPRAAIVAVLCAAAPMVSPLGLEYWPRVAQTVGEARLLAIHEYRSAFADVSSAPFWITFAVLVVATVLRLRQISQWDRSDRLLVITSGIIGVAAMMSIRNAPSFALLAAPALSRLVQESSRQRRRMPLGDTGYRLIVVATTIALAVVGFKWRDGGAGLGWQPVSPAALNAMRNCTGPIYNEYTDGGTLMWFLPEHPVFVDGRLEAYPPEFLLRVKRTDLMGQYRELFSEYRVHCAVTHPGSILAQALSSDGAMHLQFSDERWAVFVGAPRLEAAAR